MDWELHLSHWSKPLAVLEVSPNWTYGGAFQGLFGRLLYEGKPVHGFKTPTRGRSDRNARYVYIDTFNSAYGPGWKRDGAKVTHVGNGASVTASRRSQRRLPATRASHPSPGEENATASR